MWCLSSGVLSGILYLCGVYRVYCLGFQSYREKLPNPGRLLGPLYTLLVIVGGAHLRDDYFLEVGTIDNNFTHYIHLLGGEGINSS